tara:strand:- start:34 stop:384 length:351 start_codon:yes stop_codon:yes gene_type:complete
MNKQKYIDAVNVLLDHDSVVSRIRDVTIGLAREVGCDFGGIAITPETPLRQAYLDMIETAASDMTGTTSYLVHEAPNMDQAICTFPCGKSFNVKTAEAAWDFIQYENSTPHSEEGS